MTRQSLISPSEIRYRLTSWQYVARAIYDGLDGNPFNWGAGEFDAYLPKAEAMGLTLVTKTRLEREGYRLRRGVRPVGTAYFKTPFSRYADLYVLECQCVKVESAIVSSAARLAIVDISGTGDSDAGG